MIKEKRILIYFFLKLLKSIMLVLALYFLTLTNSYMSV